MTLTPLFITANSVPEYHGAKIDVYPNPTSGIINIQFIGRSGGQVKVEVYNSTGQVVLNETFNSAHREKIWQMDLTFLRDGTYWLRALSDKTQTVEQVILIR
jgi:hypothetical protein